MNIEIINKAEGIIIKNNEQSLQIQSVSFKNGEDILHLYFSEKSEIRKCEKGHIIIVYKKQ